MSEAGHNDDFGELLDRVQEGSAEAALELVQRYGAKLRRAVRRALNARRRLRSVFDSADFEQMVWGSFFRRSEELPQFDDDKQLLAFLTAMADNKVAKAARDRLSRQKHNINRECSLEESMEEARVVRDDQTSTLESLMLREQLVRFLSRLCGRPRRIVELRLQGRSDAEIAEAMGVTERTIRRFWSELFSDGSELG